MIRRYLACLSTLTVGILSKGLVVEEVGDLVHHSHPMGPFEITRYPHYDIIKENIKKQEGSLDYTLYINQLPEEAEGSEHLTDLPDELQQLQQQLLEASRVEVHSHEIEVDNSTGWPWYMATIPPGDFYDCLFLYFSCTDYEEPAWPGNKKKCTNLFDYCITYTEKHANSTDPKDPFVTKIPISSEIITSRPKPSTPAITIELPSSESTSGQKPDKPAQPSEEPKPTTEIDSSESSNGNQASTEISEIKPESSSETPVEPIASSESPFSTTESTDSSQEVSGKPTSSEAPPTASSEQPIEPEDPQGAVTQNPTNAPQQPVSSEEPLIPNDSENDSSSEDQEKPESTSEATVSSSTPTVTDNGQNISETPEEPSETPESSETPEVSDAQNKPQTEEDPDIVDTQEPIDTSSTQVSSEATTSTLSTSSTESPEAPSSSTEASSQATVGAQNQNAIVSGLPIPTKPSKPSSTTKIPDIPESSSEAQVSESTPAQLEPQEDSEPAVAQISTTESPQSSESTSSSDSPSSSESPPSSSEDPVSQSTSSEAPASSTVGVENQNAQVSGLPTPSTTTTLKPVSSSKPTPPKRPKKKPASCADLYTLKGIRESGTYPILVAGENITVYCDMETRGGGWTVLQRRGDFGTKEDYFLRKWDAYKQGFGNPEEDHWVGLKFWNNITLSTPQQLLIEMEDWFGNKTEIVVNNFIIGTEFFKFRIIYASIDGEFGESLPKKGTKFSTLDNDNDAWRNNCASRFKGAWWYSACHNSNLNGLYLKGEHESFGNGVNWYHWTGYHYSLKKTEMKVRVQSKAVSLGFLQSKKT